MPRGILDTTWINFPPNVDEAYIRGLSTPRGVSFQRVLALIDQRLRAFAATADPLVAALVSFTDAADVDGSGPTAFELEEETEYGLPRPELGERRGHMLPFRKYAKALGFTEEGLYETTEAEILRQVDNMLLTFTRGRTLTVLRRLFSDDEYFVDRKTTTVSPGFAGSGTGDNVFGGTYPDGTALPDPYTHYFRDTVANADVAADAMIALLERWHPAPYDMVGGSAAIDAIASETGFVASGSPLIRPAAGTAEALVDSSRFIGVYANKVRVWSSRLELGAEPHMAIFKTYGNFDPRNPLRVRIDPRFGRGAEVKFRSFFPLDQAVMRARWGVGVGDRTAATLARLAASGNYEDPTIA